MIVAPAQINQGEPVLRAACGGLGRVDEAALHVAEPGVRGVVEVVEPVELLESELGGLLGPPLDRGRLGARPIRAGEIGHVIEVHVAGEALKLVGGGHERGAVKGHALGVALLVKQALRVLLALSGVLPLKEYGLIDHGGYRVDHIVRVGLELDCVLSGLQHVAAGRAV